MFTLSEENEAVPFMFDGCDCFALTGCQCVPGQTDKPAAQRGFWFTALPPLQKGGTPPVSTGDLSGKLEVVPPTSFLRPDRDTNHMKERRRLLLRLGAALRARPLAVLSVCRLQKCTEGRRNRSAFNRARPRTEPGPHTHSSLVILHLAPCPPF